MTIKKLSSLIITGVVLASNLASAFAIDNANPIQICPPAIENPYIAICPPGPVTVDESIVKDIKLILNNSEVDAKNVMPYMKDKNIMVPLRLISEKLGYEVKWNGEKNLIELTKNKEIYGVKLGKDEYINKLKMFISVGSIPELKNNQTYVPVTFFEKVLNLNVNFENGKLNISDKNINDKVEELSMVGKVEEIRTTDKSKSIWIKELVGENSVVLNITNDTKIIDPITEKEVKFEDIKKGDMIKGHYSPIMTRSLPPISNAYKVEILNNVATSEGTITDVNLERKAVLINGNTGTLLLTNDETKIVDSKGNRIELKDLKKDMKIHAYHSLAMTMSLPGQTAAKKIVVLN